MSEFLPIIDVNNNDIHKQITSTLQALLDSLSADSHDIHLLALDNVYFIDDLIRIAKIKEENTFAFVVAVLENDAFTVSKAMDDGADYVLLLPTLDAVLSQQLELVLHTWKKNGAFIRRQKVYETLHDINLTLQNVRDVDTLFEKVLASIPRIIACEFADIHVIRDGKIYVRQHIGYEERGLEHLLSGIVFNADEGAFKRLFDTRHAVHIPDTQQFPDWVQVEGVPTRSYLGITLRSQQKVLGLLNVNHTQANYFTTQDVQILEIFASYISSLLNNFYLSEQFMRHTVELEARINDLLNISAVVHRLNSTLNPYEIYRILVNEIARRMFHTESMIVLTREKHLRCVYIIERGEELDPEEFVLDAEHYQGVQETLNSGRTIITREAIYEPLHSYERITGVIIVKFQKERETYGDFNEVQRTMLSTMSVLAGIALENAYLYETIYSQLGEISALYEATEILFTAENIIELSEQIATMVINKFKHQDCAIYLHDKANNELKIMAQAGEFNANRRDVISLDNDPGLMVKCFNTHQIVYVADVSEEPDYHNTDERTKSELVIPLKTAHQVLGILDLQSDANDAFDDSDIRILMAYGSRVAYAVQSGQYFEMLEQNNAELDRRVRERTIELAEALEREQAISEMRAQFVERVSHQFRTPMTAILTANQMLEQYGERMTEEQRQIRYESARNAIWEMERLLDDALMINDLNIDLLKTSESMIDVVDLTNTVIQEFREREGMYHNIRFTRPEQSVIIKMDMNLWRRVLQEVLLNAVNYSESETDVIVTITDSLEKFTVTVQDEGEGILPQDKDKVFDIFYRSDHVQNIRGTGLGLPIVKRAVELYGGSVDLQSDVGVGTCVTITLTKP